MKSTKAHINKRAKIVVADLCSKNNVESLFSKNKFDAVFHFAGLISMEFAVLGINKELSRKIKDPNANGIAKINFSFRLMKIFQARKIIRIAKAT